MASLDLEKTYMRKKAFLFAVLAGLAAPVWAADLPNPSVTPGATNPAVNQGDIDQTICIRGYTKTIRPSAYYTNRLKKVQLAQYGYADRNPKTLRRRPPLMSW
jgi:hypothetical protein